MRLTNALNSVSWSHFVPASGSASKQNIGNAFKEMERGAWLQYREMQTILHSGTLCSLCHFFNVLYTVSNGEYTSLDVAVYCWSEKTENTCQLHDINRLISCAHRWTHFSLILNLQSFPIPDQLTWSIVSAWFNKLFSFLSSPLKGRLDLAHSTLTLCHLFTLACLRDECQVSYQQGGVHTPRWEDACCCAGEAEDQKEDPFPGHWWSGRLHDLHLPLR